MMYGWFEWRGLRASRQGWTPWTLQDRQGRESTDASFELIFFLEEGCDCSYHLQGRRVTGLEYHGDQVLITHYEVKAGQNLPASPDDPLYLFFDLLPHFHLYKCVACSYLSAGRHYRAKLALPSNINLFIHIWLLLLYWWSWSGQSELHNVKHFAETSIWTVTSKVTLYNRNAPSWDFHNDMTASQWICQFELYSWFLGNLLNQKGSKKFGLGRSPVA